jgi:hypothetical protein
LFTVFAKDTTNYPIKGHDLLNSKIKLVFGESLPGCTAGRKKTNSLIMMAKRKRIIIFLTMVTLFSSFVLLAASLSPLLMLPPLVEETAAQESPEGCNKCIVIEYEGDHTAVISGVERFTNMTTLQEQYNPYLWQFVNNLVSDGFEIEGVMMDDITCEEDDNSTQHMYRVILDMP